MAYPDNLADKGVEKDIRDFFTFRPGQPDYVVGPKEGSKQWGWLEDILLTAMLLTLRQVSTSNVL